MRSRDTAKALWDIDAQISAARCDGKFEYADGLQRAKNILNAAMTAATERRILRREKRKKKLTGSA